MLYSKESIRIRIQKREKNLPAIRARYPLFKILSTLLLLTYNLSKARRSAKGVLLGTPRVSCLGYTMGVLSRVHQACPVSGTPRVSCLGYTKGVLSNFFEGGIITAT